jgi:CRP-like cAMP-binding protein
LLATLHPAWQRRLLPDLELVPLAQKAVLHEPGQPLGHVYFPVSGVISMVAVMATGGRIEVGLVGHEGLAGLPVFLGEETTPSRYVVQVPGQALRMRAQAFRARAAGDGPLHRLLLRYTGAFLTQLAQSVACNGLHSVEQRCCRWLLMTHVRARRDRFPLTHEFLAGMLGVRRASVSEVARGLQRAGLIRYVRGQLAVLDRAGLAAAACECHRVVQSHFDRLLA